MKTAKLKNFCFSILICVFMLSALTHTFVHAAQTIPGVQRLEEGIAAYGHGEYDDAIFKLEMAVYQIPAEDKENLWKAHLYLGLSYYLTGDNDEAKKEFIKAKGISNKKLPDPKVHSPKIVKLFEEAKITESKLLQKLAQLFQVGNVRKDPVTGIPKTKFRSTSKENLFRHTVKSMLKDNGFYDKYWNNSASGFHNDYKLQNDGKVVYDRASGLMWQQSGSDQYMQYKNTKAYITKLNSDRFANYNDWRFPTLEEAMSLMEPFEKNGDLYVNSVFDKTQYQIWTSDLNSASRAAWFVKFRAGHCSYGKMTINLAVFVRAVR